MEILFPGADRNRPRHRNRISDVDYLFAHLLAGRDVFVTSDRAILCHRRRLEQDFGLRVMEPRECYAFLRREAIGA